MIDIKKAESEFLEYTKKYDLEDEKIKRKQGHSLRVMAISKKIAERLNLEQEKVELATLIGLLHDIARFEQYVQSKMYKDINNFDHGDYGVKILDRDIRKYVDTNKYDNIIKAAIKNHNKYKIEEELNEEELLFAKIIRDADKLDIFYEAVEMFWKGEEQEIEKLIISEEVFDEFLKCKTIKRDERLNELDHIIGIIAFVFDLNFKESFKIIKENNYINKILDRFEFKDKNTNHKIVEIRRIIDNYIEYKISSNY